MATKKKEDELTPAARGAVKSLLQNLGFLNKETNANILGTDAEIDIEDEKTTNSIHNSLREIENRLRRTSGGEGLLSFYGRMEFQNKNDEYVQRKGFLNVNKMIENSSALDFNGMITEEMERIALYNDYRMIPKLIPQMSRALGVFVDNIISPDDLVNVELPVEIQDENLDDTQKSRILSKCKDLIKKYKLEERLPKIIRTALCLGDYFLSVVPVKKQIKEYILNENVLEEDTVLHEYQFKQNIDDINELFTEASSPKFDELIDTFVIKHNGDKKAIKGIKEKFKKDIEEIKEELKPEKIIKSINDNFTINKDSLKISSEFEKDKDEMKEFLKDKTEMAIKRIEADKKVAGRINQDDLCTVFGRSAGDTKFIDEMNGSIVRILRPERVIKLEENNVCFGYLFFEPSVENVPFGLEGRASVTAISSFDRILSNFDPDSKLTSKKRAIYELFINGISRKLNLETLRKNKEFSDVICNLLRYNYILKKKVRVTYLSPNEVVHFGIDNGEEAYYDSIFKDVIFSAKLYIAKLSSILMFSLIRAPSKRVYYIETGLDQDQGAAVNSFIRDIKSKELTFNDISSNSMTNMLAHISTFNDIYVPVVDNNKPIDVETISEDAPNLNDELLEYLLKTLTSGIGVPHAFIADSEQVQFAKSLTMENAQFLRRVVTYGKCFSRQFSHLMQILYVNEYLSNLYNQDGIKKEDIDDKKKDSKKKDKEEKKIKNLLNDEKIDIDDIRVVFPTPLSLSNTSMGEQIQGVTSIIDYMTELFVGTDDQQLTRTYKLMLAKKLIKSLPWEEAAELVTKAKAETNRKSLDKPPEDNGGGMGGDMGGDNGGMDGGGDMGGMGDMGGDNGGMDMGDTSMGEMPSPDGGDTGGEAGGGMGAPPDTSGGQPPVAAS